MSIFAHHARLSSGWARDVRIGISDGKIIFIDEDTKPDSGDVQVHTLLPALANLHSHSFQRAMAGMTEFRARGQESFWTWRELMYRFLDQLTPDHISAFAGLAFMEMQKAGYASVGEFHYVHHQNGGQRYDNAAELSQRIMEAAANTGIGLTHLPVLYSYGGVGGKPLLGGQRRFGNSVEQFADIVDRCRAAAHELPADTRIGIAPHSLRATTPGDLKLVLQNQLEGPVHIHIAEQIREVEEITAGLGSRPVEWLFENVPVDDRWCLIHATHMTESETISLAKSGAVAGLCPVTEANLGDGAFNGSSYINAGGRFGLGSDSNINISLTGELRMLEYSQRLRDMERNVLVAGEGSVGEAIYLSAAKGGAQALDRDSGQIMTGMLADLVAVDGTDPALWALNNNQFLDGLVFAANDNVVTDLWSAGRHQVQHSHHIAQDEVISRYRDAVDDITRQLN